MKLKPLSALLSALASVSLPLSADELKTDEHIQFVRGYARIDAEGEVSAVVRAWVYEQERRPGAKTALRWFTGLDLDQATPAERLNFEQRTQLFRFDSERGKPIRVRLPTNQEFVLPETNSDGMAEAELMLGKWSELSLHGNDPQQPLIRFHAVLPSGDAREFHGELVAIPATGVSVVSDIDDTIKDSNVLNRDELLKNTFLRAFKAVAGMSALYQQYAAQSESLRFHYLSSSPHQLYPALAAFLTEQQFPLGSVHLRHIDVGEELFGAGDSSQQHKLAVLHELLQRFPNRQFVLIGDSGEADPEIYAEIARAYPEQVQAIFIRNVTQETNDAPRYAKTFAGVPASRWRIFTEPQTLTEMPSIRELAKR